MFAGLKKSFGHAVFALAFTGLVASCAGMTFSVGYPADESGTYYPNGRSTGTVTGSTSGSSGSSGGSVTVSSTMGNSSSGSSSSGTVSTGTVSNGGVSRGSTVTTGSNQNYSKILQNGTALDWGNTLSFDSSYFSNFTEGSVIVLNFQNTSENYHLMKMYSPTFSNGWQPLHAGRLVNGSVVESGEITPSISSGTMYYYVSAQEAENLRNYGLLIHGGGIILNGIEVNYSGNGTGTSTGTVSNGNNGNNGHHNGNNGNHNGNSNGNNGNHNGWGNNGKNNGNNGKNNRPGSSSSTTTTYTQELFTGSFDLGSWQYFTIPAEKFADIQPGSVITISLAKSGSLHNASYYNIKLYAANSWRSISEGAVSQASKNGDTIVPVRPNSSITYTVTRSDVELLKAQGLTIQGFGLQVTKVTCTTTVTASSSSGSSPVYSSATPFAEHGALHVSGAYLYDSHNNKVQLYGMSTHGLNFGTEFSRYVNRETFRTLRDEWNTNCIRLVLYPRDYNGYCNGGNQQQLKNIIDEGVRYATELGMYVIIDWHVHNYNPRETQGQAITFFDEVSRKYAGYANVIYEICNEPTGAPWVSQIKPYAESVIPVIRKNAPNSLVIVGTNTWSQDIEGPMASPLNYKNVMYSFHFYANTHTAPYRNRLETAIRAGLPVFITEFGTCDASGNGGFNRSQSQSWFDLIAKYNISHMNWSLSNKAETASAIKPGVGTVSGWRVNSDLTESGKLVYEHFRSLRR